MAPKVDNKTEALEEQILLIEDLSADIIETLTIGKSLTSNSNQIDIFKVRISNIHSNWNLFHSTAIKTKRAATLLEKKEEFDRIVGLISQTRNAYYEAQTYDKFFGSGTNTALDNNLISETSNSEVFRLPPISLPTFNGDFCNWVSFKDTFTSLIHENNGLSNIQKFHYLKGSLKGIALQSLAAIPITTESYLQAWQVLCKKYDNKRVQAAYYLNNIFSYKPISKISLSALEHFSNTVLESSLAFKNLGLEDPAGFILTSYALSLLDPKTREKFESRIGGEELVFTEFVNFIHRQCTIVQSETLTLGTRSHSPSSPRSRISKQVLMTTTTSEESNLCPLCNTPHRIYKCYKFLDMTPQQRYKEVKIHQVCINCLGSDHTIKACRSTYTCKYCNNNHHTLLHFNQDKEATSSQRPRYTARNKNEQNTPTDNAPQNRTLSQTTQEPAHSAVLSGVMNGDSLVLLGTAIGRIKDFAGDFHTIRLLIDSGAQRSFITQACVKRLALQQRKNSQVLSGFGNVPIEDGKFKVSCILAPKNDLHPQFQTEAVVVKEITGLMPNALVPQKVIDCFREYPLADPGFWNPGQIDFLLGADLFGEILNGDTVVTEKGYPNAIKSVFGWVVTGKVEVSSQQHQVSTLLTVTSTLNRLMENFWKIEEVEVPIPVSVEDKYCEDFFTNTHSRTDSGRYMVRLPFKNSSKVILGNSRTTALHRFYKLEARLLKFPSQKIEYSSVFHEYLEKQFMVPTASSASAYFLPHHGVYKASSTTKLRIVFDASMPTSKGSINDKLIIGPKLQADIKVVILNFRKFPIAITSDICKMYLQILIHPDDRKYQHIFYRFNPSKEVQEYELTRLSFGMSCSPYLALRVLKQLINDEGSAFPLAVSAMRDNLYMDDILTGANTIEEALRMYHELQELLARGGFELKKWASNSNRVVQFIPEDLRDTPIEFTTQDEASIKILGMMWDPKTDKFYYNVRTPSVIRTKRAVLSTIARLFDPLGYLAPVIFKAKSLMQGLWKLKLQWDESLPNNINTQWERFITELKTLETIHIPRCIMPIKTRQVFIIGFADASDLGYAAAIYLRSQSIEDEINTYLLTAKTRIAPVKTLSIPRLELCAALLLVNLLNSCKKVFMQLCPTATFLFSDSTVVLGWLATPPHKLKVFVANRVVQILQLSSLESWYHVSSKDNPADIASRGIFPASLQDSMLWWQGPAWLKKEFSEWTIIRISPTSSENLPEIKTDSTLLCHTYLTNASEDEWLINVSSFSKIQIITAYILRFINNLKNNCVRRTGILSLKEILQAAKVCIKLSQNHFYRKELFQISKGEGDKTKLSSLAPFLDSLGMLRVGGRLQNSPLNDEAKHPIILHPKSQLTTKLVDHLHKSYLHAGPQLLHSLIRRQYWIPTARKVIRSRIHQCVTCHRLRATSYKPFMSPLPASRFEQGRAFLNVGIDFAGPFLTKESTRKKAPTKKAYVCLYICMSTKAVHLELVSQLTTDSFIACIDRFVARRGVPSQIFSDNAKNMVGADRRLKELWNHIQNPGTQEDIIDHCHMKQIEWNFIPPASPHFGGLWEAGVKSMKSHLVRVLNDRCLTFEELNTIIANIEAILNSRPLCPLSTSVDDIDALTPGHFIIGGPLVATPELDLTDIESPVNKLNRWLLVKKSIQDIWQRWRFEYLNSLQQRVKWRSLKRNITAGTLVLIKERRVPPRFWPAARIIETYPSKDGVVRIVKLKTPKGEYLRSVTQLAPLIPPQEVEQD